MLDQRQSFLFSIREDNSVQKIEHKKGTCEIYNSGNYLICFHNDLLIQSNFHTRSDNVSVLGNSYHKPQGLAPESDKAKFFLNHGKKEFKVEDLEIYKVE